MHIKRWDPRELTGEEGLNHFKLLIVGRSGSGKSVVLREILSHLAGRVDLTLCFSPTQESCEHFRKYVPSSCVFEGGLRLDVLARAMEVQRSLAPAGKMRELLVVCDDCAYDKGAVRGGASGAVLHDYAYNGRHCRMSLVYVCQHCYDLPPDVRSQATHVLCTVNNQHQEKKKLWQAFGGVCPTYREFDALMTSATRNRGVLVLSNADPSASLEGSVFWYRAKMEQRPFTLCKSVFWRLEETGVEGRPQETLLVRV